MSISPSSPFRYNRTTVLYKFSPYGLLSLLKAFNTEMYRARFNQLDFVANSPLLPPQSLAGLSLFGKIYQYHVIVR